MEKKDVELWQIGVSINQITFVQNDEIIFTDACETGLGGYNPRTGKAWRYRLPEWMQKQFHINILEFIASLIGIWLKAKENKLRYQNILAKTDNNSASNFDPDL